ncbi:coiled-coil domain-containing protein 40 isoform X2 [Cimex lectularius]|uniref:Coiled-coil domain-containing protein 40 n=1 Tax=Cimex lectularius TaxID=79782 RepID=A0A8I6SMR2_CIMLE|nr:coiled-coil domain-containing protein 40 isoform X2 [Cimex lectularius]
MEDQEAEEQEHGEFAVMEESTDADEENTAEYEPVGSTVGEEDEYSTDIGPLHSIDQSYQSPHPSSYSVKTSVVRLKSPSDKDFPKQSKLSNVHFDKEAFDALMLSHRLPTKTSRTSADGRSSVRFLEDPDIILEGRRAKSLSPTRKSSVTFDIQDSRHMSNISAPYRGSMSKFSFAGLPPEKGIWPFHKEQEGLALRFKSDQSGSEVSESMTLKRSASTESVLHLEFSRPTSAYIFGKKSITKQQYFDNIIKLEQNSDSDNKVSISYPLGRQLNALEIQKQFGKLSVAGLSVDDGTPNRSFIHDSTKELLRGLLPGMEEEEDRNRMLLSQQMPQDFPEVLDVDNPLMDKFQNILKTHLLNQIDRLTGQIQGLHHELKIVGEDSKKIADFVYKEERFVLKQEEDIESFRLKTNEINEKRMKIEKDVEESRQQHHCQLLTVIKAKKQENELRKEKEMIVDLVNKLKEMEANKEAALKFSKTESENARKEKAKLTDEKLKQDFLLWKLEAEVMRLGREIESSLQRNSSLQEEIKCVTGLLSKAEADLNAKTDENKLLQKAIGESLKCIAIRDKELVVAKEKVDEAKKNWLVMVNSINTYAKDVDKEMGRSEKNTSIRKQLTENLEQLRNKVKKKAAHKNELESNLETLQKYLDDSEANLEEARRAEKETKKEESRLLDEHLKQNRIFNAKKEEYLHKLSYHKKTKNMIHNIEEMINRLAEKNQTQEARITESENILAKLMVECEEAKLTVNKNELEFNSKQSELVASEQILKSIDIKRKKMRDKVLNLTSRIRMKKQKIKELETRMKIADEIQEKNSNAKKLRKLEKLNHTMAKEAETLAKEWLSLQNQVLQQKESRAHQVHEINITRKHNLTMENSKIRNDLMVKKIQSQINKSNKEIFREEKTLERWHQTSCLITSKIENAKLQLIDAQNVFSGNLKDAECEAIQLQKEHCELTNLIQELTEQLTQSHKELLAWEKKWSLALEVKERVDREREAGGELGAMKMEIHRMEVRYNQLKKAQEKLLNDLELCVSRRDKIIDNADAREKRSRLQGKQFSRVQLERKIQEMKNKLNQLIRTRKEMMDEIYSLQKTEAQLKKEHSLIKESVNSLKHGLNQLERQIEEGEVHQHSCLETTVMRQRKCKLLEELKFGKYRCIFKSPDSQLKEKTRLEDELASLYEIVESLKGNFPHLQLQLQQIENTITTDSIYINKCEENENTVTQNGGEKDENQQATA